MMESTFVDSSSRTQAGLLAHRTWAADRDNPTGATRRQHAFDRSPSHLDKPYRRDSAQLRRGSGDVSTTRIRRPIYSCGDSPRLASVE